MLAAESFERAISLCETTTLSMASLKWRRTNIHVHAYSASAWNVWLLGYLDRALKQVDQAFALARASDSKAVEEGARALTMQVFSLRREAERTRESADATLALANELGNLYRRAYAEFYLGWSDSFARDRHEGLARMQRALADMRATGSLAATSFCLSLIAQVQCLLGQYDNASLAIDDALAEIEQTGERAFEAEVHRTKGELLLVKGTSTTTQAEQSFRTAIEIARRQKARGWRSR